MLRAKLGANQCGDAAEQRGTSGGRAAEPGPEEMRVSVQMQTEMTRQRATDEEELLPSDQDRIQRRG